MSEKLSIQIALDGGAEIERQLEGIGEAGQKAFADITKSAEQVGGFKNIKPDEVTKKLQEMGVTGVDSIKKIQDAVQSAGRLETLVQGISSVETAFSALAAAAPVVGAALVAAFALAAKAAFAFADAVNKVSDQATQLGVSIEKVDQFRFALEQAGISAQGINTALAQAKVHADQFKLDQVKRDAQEVQRALAGGFGAGDAFKRLQQAADEFTPAGKAARAELVKMGQAVPGISDGLQRLGDPIGGLKVTSKDVRELGVELAKLKTLGIDIKVNDDAVTQAQKIITVLAQMPDQAKAAQIAEQQFSAAGPELVAAMRTGSLSVEQFGRTFATMTAEQEVAANKQRQTMNQLSADWERFKTQVGAPFAIAGMAALTAVWDAFKAIITTTGQELNSIATVGAGVISALAAPIQLVTSALGGLISTLAGWDWNPITAGVQVWNDIVNTVQSAGSAISSFISSLAGITWDAISSAGVAAWNAITGAIQGAIDALLRFIGLKPSAPATGDGAPGKAAGGMIGGRGTGTSDSNLAWVSRGEFVVRAAAVRKYGAGLFAALNAQRFADGGLVGGGGTEKVTLRVEDITKAIADNTDAINSQSSVIIELGRIIGGLVQTVGGLVETVTGLAQQQGQLVQSIGALMDKASGKASGGLLGGRGTGTSDSNLAWVSRGEHIMPARAVAQPGVLAFLEALRRSGGNLSRVLDGMGRFALGGLVPRMPIPAFAAGGAVGGMSHVTIAFPGLPPIGGLRASSEVVDQLQKAAALAQVRSGGRKPSRYS
jgi:hypothetical protein